MPKKKIQNASSFAEFVKSKPILILPNAWDAASAKLIELAGAKAVATTSGGVAATNGFPDGNRLPRELALATTKRIIKSVNIPVSVDIEKGYGATTDEVCETVREIIEMGGVGINIEDGKDDPSVLSAKISAIRELADDMGAPFFINARTDVYLFRLVDKNDLVDESIRRANIYTSAGADGIFVPGLSASDQIRQVSNAIEQPLNVLVVPGIASPTELESFGVARLSVGTGLVQAAMARTRHAALELLRDGTYTAFLDDAISYADMNAMFTNAT